MPCRRILKARNMALIEKREFHVIGADETAFAWESDLAIAMSHCKPENGVIRIDKVTYYCPDCETVWNADNEE